MSAKDRLESYERDWERHLRWRNPPAHDSAKPGVYAACERGFGGTDRSLTLREMNHDLSDRVYKRLESVIAQLVDEEHTALLVEHRKAAIAEARATLEALENNRCLCGCLKEQHNFSDKLARLTCGMCSCDNYQADPES
jgi:hypothetical protein